MNEESLVGEKLEQYGDLRKKGQVVSAEDLCLDCPHLIAEVKQDRRFRLD